MSFLNFNFFFQILTKNFHKISLDNGNIRLLILMKNSQVTRQTTDKRVHSFSSSNIVASRHHSITVKTIANFLQNHWVNFNEVW